MKKIYEKINSGQQVGIRRSIDLENKKYWLWLALQLYKGNYVAHIALIDESSMATEEYKIYKNISCSSIEEAFNALRLNSPVSFNEESFHAFKGQKAFYPESEESIPFAPTPYTLGEVTKKP